MPDQRTVPPAPHCDPTEWGRLVESLDVASVFVVIGSWLSAKLRSQVSVEDIWQETLWCSWRDRDQHQWQNLAAWRRWLLSIAHNRVRDAGKSLGRGKRGGDTNTATFSVLAPDESVSGLLPPRSTTPSRVAGVRERARSMEQAMSSLEPDLRVIVHRRLFEETPMREIADSLHLPLSTAKERLVRGVAAYRRALRRLLGSDGSSEAVL